MGAKKTSDSHKDPAQKTKSPYLKKTKAELVGLVEELMTMVEYENEDDDPASEKNITWRYNHALIRDAFSSLIRELRRKPTLDEVSARTDLSIKTVHSHIQNLKSDPRKHSMRIFTDDIYIAMYNGAMQGNAPLIRFWFELVEDWSPKLRIADADGDKLDTVIVLPDNGRG